MTNEKETTNLNQFKQIKHKAKYFQGLAVLFTTPTLILKTYLKSINISSSIIIRSIRHLQKMTYLLIKKLVNTSKVLTFIHFKSIHPGNNRLQMSELLDSHVPEV